jgi:hypothetical protein
MVDASDYATKGDLAQLSSELRGEMQTLRGDVRREMQQLRGEMGELRAELRADIHGGHSELLKMQVNHERWVFGALLAQFALLIGLYGLIITRLH